MNSKIALLIIPLIALAFISIPANAETGTLSLIENTFKTYTISTTAGSTTPDFTRLNVDVGDYNFIDQVFINTTQTSAPAGSPIAYATNGRSTSFTITSCGSGGGTASYSKASTAIAWYFTNPSTVTCSPLVLSYTTNIFSDLTLTPGLLQFLQTTTGNLNINQPVLVNGTSGGWIGGCANPCDAAHEYFVTYQTSVHTVTTNNYNITYQSSGGHQIFTTNITKGTINTKVLIQNATGSPLTYPVQGDNSFNTNTFEVINTYGQGIALNMSRNNGAFELVVVNSTGSGLVPTTPPNASNPSTSNCDVNCIETSKPTYNNTESSNIFGSFYPATTTVTDCLFFGFICTDKTISTESTTGYVFISTSGSTSPMRFISFTPDLNSNYNLFTSLDIGTYQAQLFGFAGPGTTCTNGIVYDFPFIPLGCYYPHNITTFNVVNNSGNLSIAWQTKISNSTAIYGDTVTVAWSNVTANDTVVIYDNNGAVSQFYNINQSTVSQIPVFIPLYTIGTWNATIYNGSNSLHKASAFLNVVPPGSVDVNNSFGITMYWSKAADIVGNPTLLNWNTGTYTGYYNISVLQNGNEIRRTSYFGVPGQVQQASYTFGEQGAYVAQFLDFPNGTVQGQADIFISAAASNGASGGGVTPPNESSNNLVGASNLIMNLPWIGLVLLIVVIFGLVKNGVEGGNFVFAIAITTSIEALIGLWQQWGIYITVLSWLLVAVFFRLNKTIEV